MCVQTEEQQRGETEGGTRGLDYKSLLDPNNVYKVSVKGRVNGSVNKSNLILF